MNTVDELKNFIDRAARSRKYAPNVATNYRSPLKWIEPELTDEEKTSFDVLKKNLDQIFNLLYTKHDSKLSAISIEIYKKRMTNLISDYEKYGKDPSAMANWSRPILVKPRKTGGVKTKVTKENPESIGQESGSTMSFPVAGIENSVDVGEFKLILPLTWDLDKVRKAIAIGKFKGVYEDLENLFEGLKKQPEEKT